MKARFPRSFSASIVDPRLSSISAKKLDELTRLTWAERGENLLLSGPTGLGKTLLFIRLGKQAIDKGYRTFVIEKSAGRAALRRSEHEPAGVETGSSGEADINRLMPVV